MKKLKPAPKPVVTNNTTNQVTQTGSIKSVKIGTQTWMTENLNVSTFRNGDTIPEAKTKEEWELAEKEGKPAWCYYNYDSKNGLKYGKIYNRAAINDSRGLAPKGWTIPTNSDWEQLKTELADETGKKMKSTSGWDKWKTGGLKIECSNCKNWSAEYRRKTACHVCRNTRDSGKKTPVVEHSGNGSNNSGFSALPGGWVNGNKDYWFVKPWEFNEMGSEAIWWSSTIITIPKNGKELRYNGKAYLSSKSNDLKMEEEEDADNKPRGIGLYVRCIKEYTKPGEVVIGNQTWMAENLSVTTYRNGDPVEWGSNDYGYDPWYSAAENDIPTGCNYDKYSYRDGWGGRLYNWHAVNDPRGLAPEGWRIASVADWEALKKHLGADSVAKLMKNSSGWPEGKTSNATNESGFSAFPNVTRKYYKSSDSDYDESLESAQWWSASEEDLEYAHSIILNDILYFTDRKKGMGLPVRCIKD